MSCLVVDKHAVCCLHFIGIVMSFFVCCSRSCVVVVRVLLSSLFCCRLSLVDVINGTP